jgi:uncharacterized protein YggE
MRAWLWAVLAGTLLFVSAAGAQPAPPVRSITTNGQATVYLTPNLVNVTFGIENFDPSLDDVKSENDQAATTLVAAIKGMGIDDKDIQAAQMNIEIVYENAPRPIQGIQGYRATRFYSVNLRDAKRFDELIDTAIKNGANRLQGFSYDESELESHRQEARLAALAQAKDKAAGMAGALGCELGKPLTVQDELTTTPVYYNLNSARAFGGAFGGGAIAGNGDTMPLGQISVQGSVRVTFELKGN